MCERSHMLLIRFYHKFGKMSIDFRCFLPYTVIFVDYIQRKNRFVFIYTVHFLINDRHKHA